MQWRRSVSLFKIQNFLEKCRKTIAIFNLKKYTGIYRE